jgi:hypothetical protein
MGHTSIMKMRQNFLPGLIKIADGASWEKDKEDQKGWRDF